MMDMIDSAATFLGYFTMGFITFFVIGLIYVTWLKR